MIKKINSNQMRNFIADSFSKTFWYDDKNYYNRLLHNDFRIRKIILKKCLEYKLNVSDIKIIRPFLFTNKNKKDTCFVIINLIDERYGKKNNLFIYCFKLLIFNCLKTIFNKNLLFKIKIVKRRKDDISKILLLTLLGIKKRIPIRLIYSNLIEILKEKRNIKGFKLLLSGRINGKDKKTKINYKWGNAQIQCLKSKVIFKKKCILTKDGLFGARIWINLYE